MATVVRDLVEGIGIADVLPDNPNFFTEVTIPETICLPEQKPDMEQLLSVMVDAQVISVRLVKTPANVESPEGQFLSGCKLVIELKLREKVKYVADEPTQSVHAAHFENVIKSVFVVVPCTFPTTPPRTIEELLRLNKVVVTPYIEDIYAKMIDKRCIFKNIAILVDVTFPGIWPIPENGA
jgi:hypothetical protein